jgi:5'-deoxynucleotidase YfbR-like HD superfamily hydrolase
MGHVTPTSIQTASGIFFDVADPRPDDIRIEDIAASLSKQCRFSGHTSSFYSVAQHSLDVCDLLRVQGYAEGVQRWGLLHDASEAYLVDLPSPVKNWTSLGVVYRALEVKVMRAICRKFGLPYEGIMPSAVERADARCLATEARDLMLDDSWCKAQPRLEKIEPWSSDAAETIFLWRFDRLFGGIS